jgi:hypothetical protein
MRVVVLVAATPVWNQVSGAVRIDRSIVDQVSPALGVVATQVLGFGEQGRWFVVDLNDEKQGFSLKTGRTIALGTAPTHW